MLNGCLHTSVKKRLTRYIYGRLRKSNWKDEFIGYWYYFFYHTSSKVQYIQNPLWRRDSNCFVTDYINQQIYNIKYQMYFDDTTSRDILLLLMKIYKVYIRPKIEASPTNSDHYQSTIDKVFLGFIDGRDGIIILPFGISKALVKNISLFSSDISSGTNKKPLNLPIISDYCTNLSWFCIPFHRTGDALKYVDFTLYTKESF